MTNQNKKSRLDGQQRVVGALGLTVSWWLKRRCRRLRASLTLARRVKKLGRRAFRVRARSLQRVRPARMARQRTRTSAPQSLLYNVRRRARTRQRRRKVPTVLRQRQRQR